MGWIFFQESAGSELPLNHGLEQWPIVNESHTLKAFYCPGCDRVTLIGHQSGMMSPPSEPKCCQKSTLSLEDSPARISASQTLMQKAWQESEVDFSSKSFDLPESADQLSFFSKMSLPYELVEEKQWSKNWPKSGMTVGGLLFQPPQLEPPTKETGGFCWPTITASEGGFNKSPGKNSKPRPTLTMMARHNLWPTPSASDSCRGPGKHYNPKSRRQSDRTLTTFAIKETPNPHGGQLNPQWVEWLMGYKIGHTELSALETAWYHSKLGRRSKSSQD